MQLLSFSLNRIGFVFILNTDEDRDGNEDAGVALWRAFNYITDEQDVPEAWAAIIDVSTCKQKTTVLTEGCPSFPACVK